MRKKIALLLIVFAALSVRAQTSDQINLLLTTLPAGRDPQRYKGYVEPQFKAFAPRNKGTFIRIPAEGNPTIAVQRNNRGFSSIELPVVRK